MSYDINAVRGRLIAMTTQMDGYARTAAARAARTRRKHERFAAELIAAGWKVAAPDGSPSTSRPTDRDILAHFYGERRWPEVEKLINALIEERPR